MKARERKDRIVQTRIPGELEDALREAAEQQHVSVSQLIRNLLEDTFHLVDNIVADSAGLMDSITRDAQKLAASARGRKPVAGKQESVDAWQAVVLNREAHCAVCKRTLAAGSQAWQGSGAHLSAPVWRCDSCLPRNQPGN